jgi:pimeloyl-ACP methyl ester carboxylesterase
MVRSRDRHGEVLDVASNGSADGAQVQMAIDRIRHDEKVRAIYGFSGGGYNTRRIYARLNRGERQRIRKIVVVGSPGVTGADFPESADVLIKNDPPTGHLAGPKALLDSLSY